MKKRRMHCAPEEKAAILSRHSLEHEPVSKLCDESQVAAHGLSSLAEAVLRECSAAFEQTAIGGLPPADVHDARCRYRDGLPVQRVASDSARPACCRTGTGSRRRRAQALRSRSSRMSMAHRRLLPQHRREILLPVQRPGWLQPVHRELGHPITILCEDPVRLLALPNIDIFMPECLRGYETAK